MLSRFVITSLIIILIIITVWYWYSKYENLSLAVPRFYGRMPQAPPLLMGQQRSVYNQCITSCGDPNVDTACYSQCQNLAIGR